jgi:hypothetical protein
MKIDVLSDMPTATLTKIKNRDLQRWILCNLSELIKDTYR